MTPVALSRALFACLGLGLADLAVLNVAVLPNLLSAGPGASASTPPPAPPARPARWQPSPSSSAVPEPSRPLAVSAREQPLATPGPEQPHATRGPEQPLAASAREQLSGALAPLAVVEFERSSSRVVSGTNAALRSALAELRTAGEIFVVGHADASGPVALNERLSAARALTVARQLAELGIARSHIRAQGRGAREPRAAGNDRRVEIYLQQPGQGSNHEQHGSDGASGADTALRGQQRKALGATVASSGGKS